MTDRKTVKRKEEPVEHFIKKSNNPKQRFIDIAGSSDAEDDEPRNTDAHTLPMPEDLADPWIAEQLCVMTTGELDTMRLKERLAPITEVQRQQVLEALCPPHSEEILTYNFGIPVTRRIVRCLNPGVWLNDEIINFQMQLLQDYDKRLCANIPTRKQSHFFNLFFMSRLFLRGSYSYEAVTR